MALDSASLAEIAHIRIPERYDVALKAEGLQVDRLVAPSAVIAASVSPFKSRGPTCRRVIATGTDGRKLVIEFSSFSEQYEPEIDGVIRASEALIEGDMLVLKSARFRDQASELAEIVSERDAVKASWSAGITFRPEVRNEDGSIIQTGLRLAQRGALHAIASHWTLGSDPALVVMPTGTGKTEVMVAASVSASADRVLVIVPNDALRLQTREKFLTYGLLQQIGVLGAVPKPVVGMLSSKPSVSHFDALKSCNVVVTTMNSIGLADATVQEQFAGLFTHVFFDEAHHMEAATWKRFRAFCGKAHVLLFTATPFREDGKVIEGRIIYNFPLSAAQQNGYFQPIRFVEVFEPDSKKSDEAIAEAAVSRLREDIAAGYDHIMMARASNIDRAEALLRHIYEPKYADLKPVAIHSRTPGKRRVLNAIRNGRHRIVICVDMFGEGFDLPRLKVAALHNIHKSLGITLQFIGRFARTSSNVGQATFVANTAEDGVPEALENLYYEDADWNLLLPELSYDAINPQEQLSDLVSGLTAVVGDDGAPDISTIALKPKISAQVYRTSAFSPEGYADAFSRREKIYQPQISRRDNFLVLVVNQQETIDWTDSRDIAMDSWDLYLAYYDPNRQLLYLHCSRKGNATERLAKAISDSPALISGEEVFKSFSRLKRLTLHSVGLSSRSKNVRYQMFAGLDVRNAIDPILQQDKMKSNVTGVGYQDGKRHTVGSSRKGKIWSMSSGSIARWRTWCDEIGAKLSDANAQPDDFLKHTLIPSIVGALPAEPVLMVDWPDQLFESSNFRFEITVGDKSYDFHDCQLDIERWETGQQFVFALSAGEDHETILELTIQPAPEGSERDSTYTVRHVSGPDMQIRAAGQTWSDAEFFEANPPLVRLGDGSQLSGNILLKPREALPETYDRATFRTIDWSGVDLRKESRWKHGAFREDSIQQRFIAHLESGLSTFIIDDDDNGECADVVSIEETQDKITVTLWHCKYSSGSTPGERAADLYEVCGQAQKSAKWTWSFDNIVKHLIVRETEHKRARPSRFIRGSQSSLVTLRKGARRKFIEFRIGIVQPGISRANIPDDHLAIIGATSGFVQCITDSPLIVYSSQ